jgi:hypothetical protein
VLAISIREVNLRAKSAKRFLVRKSRGYCSSPAGRTAAMREFLIAARERAQPLPTNFMAILLQPLCRLAKARIYTIRDDFENDAAR